MSSGSGSAVPTIKSYKQDGKTTYCYYMDGVKYTENLATIKPSDITARGVGSECPIQLTVTYPLKVTARSVIPLSMKAVVNDKTSVPKGFQFTFPVSKAVVPEALRATSNNASANGLPLDKAQFDIAVANFGICDYRNCDIFTDFTNIQGNYYPSSNNPQNFDTRVATFGSNEIQIPRESKYTGFAHIVVSVAGIARSDYVSFFPIQVGDLPGTQPGTSIVADSKTTYCWVSRGVSPFEPRLEDAGLIVRMNNNCPGTMIAALSKSSVLVGENVNLQYSMQLDGTRDPTTIVGEVSGTTTVKDPDTGIYSEVPIAVFSSCLQNLDDPKKTCSTYSGGNSRTTDITTWRDQNLTAGAVTYSSSHSFDSAGQYLIISRVVMVTTDGDRIDMAVYSTLQVTIPASSSGSLFLYLGLGIGALILLLGFLFCFMRKRRQRNKMKQIPFRTPMPPGSTHERTSQYTTTSSHFVTHRSPQMHNFPVAYPQHENNPYYPSDKNQYEPRQDSFSLDPYGRNSFNEMGEDESLDMTIRPSDASKFSFQTGYDDQSDFDYDTSYRSNAQSEYSNGTRGTFHLHANAPSQMPIMEEDDRRYQQKYGGWNMRS